MQNKFLLAIDQGTTSTRTIIFNRCGDVIYEVSKEITQYYPFPGWVEHDANEIFEKTLACMFECIFSAKLSFKDIAAIGITNQRETIVVWDKKTKKPVYNAIVWQSLQSKEITDNMSIYNDLIKEKTGLKINPYFSASKLRWLFDNYPKLQKRANNGELLCGTIDSWLIYNLTDGNVHATDYSNASRTLLFNIHTLSWDEDLLKLFNIPKCILPEVKESSGIFGYLSNKITQEKIPISGVAGDQQASLFGQCCYQYGDLKNTYGTGCFTLMNTGTKIVNSKYGLLSTIAWKINGQITYAIEGSIFIAGAAIQWLRDELKIIKSASDSEKYACSLQSTEGVYVVPAFTGLGTPYWDDECKGAIFGLTRGTSKEIITRATLESIAYQSKDVIETMKKETKANFTQIYVDGGATVNKYLMQFQADILNSKIIVPATIQTTALGAAFLAGLGIKYYKNVAEITKLRKINAIYEPKISKNRQIELYKGWKKAVKVTRMFKNSVKN